MTINVQETINTIEELVNINSPSGFADPAIDYCNQFAKSLNYDTSVTHKGGLLIHVPGKNNKEQRLITAHVDTLGAIVKDIKDDGRIQLDLIGGFHFNAIEGEYCTITTQSGKEITGTICLHETSVHVYKNNNEIPRDKDHMEVRIDEKVFTADDTRALGIEIGDAISFDPRFVHTSSGFVKSRHLDDKASVAMILQFLKYLKDDHVELPHTTIFYISNNEEIGYGSNSSIPENVVELIAFDMGALGDGQASDEYTVSICVKDASGPYHVGLRNHFVSLCKEHDIKYKLDIYPYYASDASAALSAGADIRHGLFGAGIESSHALERTHEDSIIESEKLLRAYCLSEINS
ncbi:M42 family metallopeptidase [Mammaliicoccus stepanovicii]|uniref:Deblocking aminopeptidase n=1 Tax=Mammaliicoccus stepanovicii TaxID=643214 RepID=A0A239ZD17_9STAP|nr:M42 family metallopeptidase [Mammaliicoccus stepanovicii]PNZ74131.1 aminopeptidase [Mammaliicoccus stepanovicii]GGI42086.1 aminopeptidase [Mammaliicoccus stepanovicii]SNV68506.1 Deblocking aminopeptidase [Mammaliicoccus stepanovicii]